MERVKVAKAAVLRRLPVSTYARAVLLEAAERDLAEAEKPKANKPIRPLVDDDPPLSEAEKEALLGRPLAHGLSFGDYKILTGRGLPSSSGAGSAATFETDKVLPLGRQEPQEALRREGTHVPVDRLGTSSSTLLPCSDLTMLAALAGSCSSAGRPLAA